MKIGSAESDDKLNSVLKSMGVNECCTLVFTVIIIYEVKYLLYYLIVVFIYTNSRELKVHQKQSWLAMITSLTMHILLPNF